MILEGDGGTMSVNDSPLPTVGFYVGGSRPGAQFIGWWKDQETSKIHLDWVDCYADETLAREVGAIRGEIAIYDIANAKEIRL